MRKIALSGLAFVFSVGLALAGEVTFLKFDKEKKELTVKEDDKEKTYKVSDKTKFQRNDKEVPNDKGLEYLAKQNDNEKAKGNLKLEITAEKDAVTEIKWKKQAK